MLKSTFSATEMANTYILEINVAQIAAGEHLWKYFTFFIKNDNTLSF